MCNVQLSKMCDDAEKNNSQFFRPWKQENQDNEPSAFIPIQTSRSCSVNSDDTSNSCSSNSLAMLRHFVDEKTADKNEALWMKTAATTCYQLPVTYPGYLENNYSWLTSNYHSVQEAVNRLNQQDAVAKQIKKLRPKKFKCEFCNVAFSNNGQLKGHLRIHTGERPFQCDTEGCNKAFTRNEELTRHKRIHTGLRPYLCPVCHKGFGRKDHLKKHSRTHEARHIVPGYHQQLAMAAVAAYASYHHPPAIPYALV